MDGGIPPIAASAAIDAYLARPSHMIVEAASRCNFLCPLCLWTKNKKHGYLDIETFSRFAEQAVPHLERVCFAGRGEPTLNPDLYPILRMSVKAGIVTDLATNGSSLLADVDAILDAGIDYVNVSIEADNAVDYARYRVNGDFAQVTAGMARLAAEKRRRGLDKPGLRTCSVIFNYNEDRLAQLRRFFADLGFEGFIFKSAHLGHGLLAESETALAERWLPADASKRRRQHRGRAAGLPVCGFLQRGHLLWNGDVCRCAIDHQVMIAGNIHQERFEDIWTGQRSRDIVRQVVGGQLGKCAQCSFSGRQMTEAETSIFLL
jgi:MoaA/NifB/PqqE/SkfB family radical SAM enzyme